MGQLIRVNPETPCQPDGVHHPHRWRCADPYDCGGPGFPCDYRPLDCCVCGQEWPCPERQRRDTAKREEVTAMQHDPFAPPPGDGPQRPLPEPVPPRR